MGETDIPLAGAIKALRADLNAAMAEGADDPLRFRLGPVEMEFLVSVTKEAGANAGVRFWVVEAGAKAGVTSASTHRLKLQLQPVDRSGRDAEIRDQGSTNRPRFG
jgi:hypothetical protein